MMPIENYFQYVTHRQDGLLAFHTKWIDKFNLAAGSAIKHHAWPGGYRDHLEQCMKIAQKLYDFKFDFSFESVIMVIYFHDIEKMFRYVPVGSYVIPDKWKFYNETLPDVYGIRFTEQELNGLKYVHGEGEDYSPTQLVMNSLAAFCHSCDVISARCFYDKKDI